MDNLEKFEQPFSKTIDALPDKNSYLHVLFNITYSQYYFVNEDLLQAEVKENSLKILVFLLFHFFYYLFLFLLLLFILLFIIDFLLIIDFHYFFVIFI